MERKTRRILSSVMAFILLCACFSVVNITSVFAALSITDTSTAYTLTGDKETAKELAETALNCEIDTNNDKYVTYTYKSNNLTANADGKYYLTGLQCKSMGTGGNDNSPNFKFSNNNGGTVTFTTDGMFDINISSDKKTLNLKLTKIVSDSETTLVENEVTNVGAFTATSCKAGTYTIASSSTTDDGYADTIVIKVYSGDVIYTPKISGTVTLDSTAKSGVEVALNGTTTTTDDNGKYSFDATELVSGKTYTVSIADTAYYEGVSTEFVYEGESKRVNFELKSLSYKVNFTTNIKDYKNYFNVYTKAYFDSNKATIAKSEKDNDKNIVYSWSDSTTASDVINQTGDGIRYHILHKTTTLPVGDYVLVYKGSNFDVKLNDTMFTNDGGNTCVEFNVSKDTSYSVTLVPKSLNTGNITLKFPDKTLENGTTSMEKAAQDIKELDTVYASSYGSVDSTYGALTSANDDNYVAFVVPDGTYKVSIQTSMQSACLYAYADGASIDGSLDSIAMDSYFGTYSLMLTGGKYVIKGASTSETVVKNITIYSGSYVSVVGTTWEYGYYDSAYDLDEGYEYNNYGAVVILQLGDDIISGGIRVEDINAGDVGIAYSANKDLLTDPQKLRSAIDSGVFIVPVTESFYRTVYHENTSLARQNAYSNEVFHGYFLEDLITVDNLYVVGVTKLNGVWNPDEKVVTVVERKSTTD